MFGFLRKRFSPRRLAVYIVTTVLGGAVVTLALILLGLLYWMNASRPLPEWDRFLLPGRAAGLVLILDRTNGARHEAASLADYLCRGAPDQVRNLVAKGLADRSCPVRIVASAAPGEDGQRMSLAISLGRYPGQFRLVRRDLERRVANGSLDAAMSSHREKTVFGLQPQGAPFDRLALVDCTVLRARGEASARTLIDRQLEQDPKRPDRLPVEWPERHPGDLTFFGWMDRWDAAALDRLPSHAALRASVEAARRLREELPALAEARAIWFEGAVPPRGRTRLQVSFAVRDREAASELAARLPGLLTGPGAALAARTATAEASGETVRVRIRLAAAAE